MSAVMENVDKVEAAVIRLCEEHGASAEGGNIFYTSEVATEAGIDGRMVGMVMKYVDATLLERWVTKHRMRVRYVKQGRERMFYVNAIEVHPDSPLANYYR